MSNNQSTHDLKDDALWDKLAQDVTDGVLDINTLPQRTREALQFHIESKKKQ